MQWLIIIGATLSLIGLAGLVASAIKVIHAKRQNLDDATLRARVQKAMALNMAALALSVLGLMSIIMGISLS